MLRFFLICSLLLHFSCQTTEVPQQKQGSEKPKINERDSKKAVIRNKIEKGEFNNALAMLRPMLKAFPQDFEVKMYYGLTQMALKNTPVAIKYFKAAYRIEPSVANALNITSAYIELKKYKKARKILAQVIRDYLTEKRSYSFPERLYHNYGITYYKEENYAKAEKYFAKALEYNPTFYMSLMLSGDVKRKLGREKEAREYFISAMNTCPTCYDPLEAAVSSFLRTSNNIEAMQLLDSFLRQSTIPPQSLSRAKDLQKRLSPRSKVSM